MAHTNEVQKRDPLEERLMPWIEQGEYVIILTLIIMAWTAGWVNLLAYQSGSPIILGRYSPGYLLILLPYTLIFVPLIWMFRAIQGLTTKPAINSRTARLPLRARPTFASTKIETGTTRHSRE